MATGKEIFDELEQYPLPQEAGTKDYIFYFVSASDNGYGDAAHRFFNKFYTNYIAKDISSLEEMIGALYADVNSGVKRIREIIMVAHGTPQGLMPPVFTAASATNLPEYRHITENSLSFLNKDLANFSTFSQRRAAVIAHLFSDSCVTIRACRIGRSQVCMYALYAFFGGRANVYAPKEYVFFGQQFLLPGSRVENRVQMHEHLVKQHFLPNDQQTPERKDTIVKAILDPASFSSPAQLAVSMSTSSPSDLAAYNALVSDLNAQNPTDALRAAFSAAGQTLSGSFNVRAESTGQRWTIFGTVSAPGGTFRVVYEVVQEKVAGGVALMNSARVLVTKSAESFPFQLFFFQGDEDRYTGKIISDGTPFRLAAYIDGTGADAANQQKFKTVVQLLDSNQYATGSIDLRTIFKDVIDITLSQQPAITRLTAGTGDSATLSWSIGGTPSYQIKQEIAVANDATQVHTLTVYSDQNTLARNQESMKTLSGLDPDMPGTELANYLDQFSLDELGDLVDYLRTPYRTSNVYYIRHAQNAISRKRGSEQWESIRLGADLLNQPIPRKMYTQLDIIENDDLRTVAYSFDFNVIWQEVKQSFPALPTFQNDLFTEDDLWARLYQSEAMPDPNSLAELYADSPYQDLETLRKLESQGLDNFFVESKDVYQPPTPEKPTCNEFEAIIQKWKELQGQPLEDIREQLLAIVTPEGKSYYDYLWEIFEWYNRVNDPLELIEATDILKFLDLEYLGKSIPVLIVENINWLEESLVAKALSEEVSLPLSGIFMWYDFVHEQQELVEFWEGKGKLVAVRQWLSALLKLAQQGSVTDEPVIDIGDDYFGAYADQLGVPASSLTVLNIPFPDDFKAGFEEGKEDMERLGKVIIATADETSTNALTRTGLQPCNIQALKDAGIIDSDAVRSQSISAIVKAILRKLPSA